MKTGRDHGPSTRLCVYVDFTPGRLWWLGSRVVSVLDSGAEGPGSNCSRYAVGYIGLTVLGKLFIPIVPLFTKQQKW